MFPIDDVDDSTLVTGCRREIEDVDEKTVLLDRLGAPAPRDELELSDLAIRFEIMVTSGVASSE